MRRTGLEEELNLRVLDEGIYVLPQNPSVIALNACIMEDQTRGYHGKDWTGERREKDWTGARTGLEERPDWRVLDERIYVCLTIESSAIALDA